MTVVVEQTLPFSSSTLALENPSRWNNLFPLIRPSVKSIQTSKGQSVLVDTAHAGSKSVHIVAFGTSGNLSSKLLDNRYVTAIVTETGGAGILTAADLPHTLENAGIGVSNGVVVVRAGKMRHVESHAPEYIEIELNGELEQNHVLQLLGTAKDGVRSNPHEIAELLNGFVEGVGTAHSKFHTEKVEGNPAVLHAEGAAGFRTARHAVERDLKYVMKNLKVGEGEEVVYSVHFSDVNGLSRLENYIIAGEIAQFLDSQDIQYALSHSTILNHTEAARGFSISICPILSHFLAASPKPKKHPPIGASATDSMPLTKRLSSSSYQINFNDAKVRARIKAGCNAVVKAEPMITEYDTIVGDGDCGYTLRDGAKQVLSFISSRDLGKLPETVAELVAELEVNMGGTSGALYCIFLTALAASLASESSVPAALQGALEQLCKYTNARVGDRTMMDALIPFVETFSSSGGDARLALERARKGVEGTKNMQAKLGRSTYLNESATRGVPDPGAYGLLVLFEGMSSA